MIAEAKVIVFLSIATWYGEAHEGKIMKNGEPFHMDDFTCATYLYPLETYLYVTHGDKTVLVEVTDRCDDKTDIDLSKHAFSNICDLKHGRIEVIIKFDIDAQTESWRKRYEGTVKPPEITGDSPW